MRFNLKTTFSRLIHNLPPQLYGRWFKLFNLYLQYPIIIKVIDDQMFVQDKTTKFRVFNSRPLRISRYNQGVKLRCERLLFSYCLEDLAIPDNSIIIDIGANVGEVSYALTKRNKSVRIIAIEPDPQEFKDLVRNVNCSSSIVLNEAVADYTGEIDLYLNNNSGDSSVFFTAGAQVKVSSKCTTLDDIYKKHVPGEDIFLIKCEAEGFEPEVLLGGYSMLSNTKYISCDTGPERMGASTLDDVNKILVSMNFQLVKSRKNRHLYLNIENLVNC
jgi:FkbM family methyltransferase